MMIVSSSQQRFSFLLLILTFLISIIQSVESFATDVSLLVPSSLSNSNTRGYQTLSPSSSSSSLSPVIIKASVADNYDEVEKISAVRKVLEMARKVGPIGADASQADQDELVRLSEALLPYSDLDPAGVELDGVFNLIYSASTGSSSGKLFGPFHGSVKQEFLENNDNGPEEKKMPFINSVTLLSPYFLKASLRANGSDTKDSSAMKVTFQEMKIELFGKTVMKNEIKGTGVWKYLFMGKIPGENDGEREKMIRIMKTPSLFILEEETEEANKVLS